MATTAVADRTPHRSAAQHVLRSNGPSTQAVKMAPELVDAYRQLVKSNTLRTLTIKDVAKDILRGASTAFLIGPTGKSVADALNRDRKRAQEDLRRAMERSDLLRQQIAERTHQMQVARARRDASGG